MDQSRSNDTKAKSSAESSLDATYVPDTEATFLPDLTEVSASPSQEKRAGSEKEKSSEPNSATRKSGTSQLGKYKLTKKLGKGGMGEVYLGEDTKLGRLAAVKVLSKALADKEDFVARFYKEARSMARISHENAVSVYDVDEDHGIHYVAMEFVDGKSMQKWMDTLGKLSVGDALHVTLRCAEALQFAHGQNLIHRDIKPDNIMLTSKGKVKVADFGLAKALDDDLSMTASGTGLGTPYYMAPEQARNAKYVDARADIYALGIMLYYFLTGKLPFLGDSATDVILAKEKGRFESPRKLNPEVPDRLDLMICKMVEKDLERRFKNIGEVIQMLSGLGLENASLSFIDASDRLARNASAGSAQASPKGQGSGSLPGRTVPLSSPRTSSLDTGVNHRQPPTESTPVADTWIVQFKSAQGKDTVGKLTTSQIQTALKNGTLDQKARAKKNAADSFAPIAYYPEFQKAVEGRIIREKAEMKSAGLKSEFATIGRQYDRRGWTRWFRNLISGTAGLISLLVWLVVVFGGLAAFVAFRQPIWDKFAEFYNSFQK